MLFFKHVEDTTDEDLKDIAEKSPIINLAYDELNKERWSEKDLVAYEERLMDLRKEETILAYRLDTAKEEGKKEREIEIAKAMLAEGMNVASLAKVTVLSNDEIEKLRFTYDQDKKRADDLS